MIINDSSVISILILSILGLIIGFIGGMVGLVLGVLRFPIILGNEISASVTAGTNIGISTLGAAAAAIRHFKQNNVYFRVFIIFAISGSVGAFLGSLLTRYSPTVILLSIIVLILSYESYTLIRGSSKVITKNKRKQQDIQHDTSEMNNTNNKKGMNSIVTEFVIGFGIGFLGGLVGLVLGSIRMPTMISILKMQPKVAIGTNLAASTVMGMSGLAGHLINNEVDYLVLATMGPAAMLGGYIGARYTNRFSERNLKRIIGIVLIAVVVSMLSRIYYLL